MLNFLVMELVCWFLLRMLVELVWLRMVELERWIVVSWMLGMFMILLLVMLMMVVGWFDMRVLRMMLVILVRVLWFLWVVLLVGVVK